MPVAFLSAIRIEKKKDIAFEISHRFAKENVEEKRKQRGQNSFVAPHGFYEFQLDSCFISKNDLESQQKSDWSSLN